MHLPCRDSTFRKQKTTKICKKNGIANENKIGVFAVEKPQPVRFFTFLSTRLAVQSLLLVIKYAYGSCPRYKDAMLVIFSYIYTHLAPGPLRGAKNRQASSGPSHTQAKTTPRTVDRVFICIPPLLIIHTRT